MARTGAMTAEEIAEATAADPFCQPAPPSIPVRGRYYLTECEHCGWVGSSEQCRPDDEDVICPACLLSICGDGPDEADTAKHGEAVYQRIVTAEAAASTLRTENETLRAERDAARDLAGLTWTASDVDTWGQFAEGKGASGIRDRMNRLFRRAATAEEQVRQLHNEADRNGHDAFAVISDERDAAIARAEEAERGIAQHDEMRKRLDKRIHCQRLSLRQNWEIVEMRMGVASRARDWRFARKRYADLKAAEAKLAQAEGEIATMRSCLEQMLPGPLCGEAWGCPDTERVSIVVTFGAIRAARGALTTPEPSHGD